MWIDYAGMCVTGSVRSKNEDNLLLNGQYLPEINDGMSEIMHGRLGADQWKAAAVFDGIGGASAGELAAHAAASTLSWRIARKVSPPGRLFFERHLKKTCMELNRAVLLAAGTRKIAGAATTFAAVFQNGGDFYGVNIGDSRIYEMNGGAFRQVSVDHVRPDFRYKKSPLSQYLGVAETEFVLDPHIERMQLSNGSTFLLCTDGLTDLVSERELEAVLSEMTRAESIVSAFGELVHQRGAVDNTTIIALKVTV